MRRREPRLGATFGDVVLLLAAASLAAALLRPGLESRARDRHLARVVEDVEALVANAESARAGDGVWPSSVPAPGGPGEAGEAGEAARYRLEWRRLSLARLEPTPEALTADVPEDVDAETDTALAPPEPSVEHIGIVSVHAADAGTLVALLERYGDARSFVHDTVWNLVLPRTPRSTP